MGNPGDPDIFWFPAPRYSTCANLLTQDHWQIQGYSSSGHSINQESLQKWTGGTHLHIWHTWLQWNHRILIVWIIFLVKYSGGNLQINAQHVRMSVSPSVSISIRLSVAMIYYIPTYIMSIRVVEFSAWAFQIDYLAIFTLPARNEFHWDFLELLAKGQMHMILLFW
jgi:hypothetical protein